MNDETYNPGDWSSWGHAPVEPGKEAWRNIPEPPPVIYQPSPLLGTYALLGDGKILMTNNAAADKPVWVEVSVSDLPENIIYALSHPRPSYDF